MSHDALGWSHVRTETTLRAETGQIRGISFSRDGQLLAGAAYSAATIIWDLGRVRSTLRGMKLDWAGE